MRVRIAVVAVLLALACFWGYQSMRTKNPGQAKAPGVYFYGNACSDVKSVSQKTQNKEVQASENTGSVTMVTVANKGQREKALKDSIQKAMAR